MQVGDLYRCAVATASRAFRGLAFLNQDGYLTDTPEMANGHRYRQGDQGHLGRAAHQKRAAHSLQLFEREPNADGEKQQEHACLGKILQLVLFLGNQREPPYRSAPRS